MHLLPGTLFEKEKEIVTSTQPLSFNLKGLMDKILAVYQERDFHGEFEESEEKIKKLLADFQKYKSILGVLNLISKNQSNKEQKSMQDKIQNELSQLGDNMKYDNPYIWIKYKFLAYKNEGGKSIHTIGDLKKHCNSGGDICGKRFDFLNTSLISKYNIDLTKFQDEISGDDICENKAIIEICHDHDFMSKWTYYEYYLVGNRTAKWENYIIGGVKRGKWR